MQSETEVPPAQEEQTTEAPPAEKPAKARKPKKTHEPGTILRIDTGDVKAFAKIKLPESEDDPHWDPKMKLPVPQSVVDGLAEFGWDESQALACVEAPDGSLHIENGRTRVRAVPRANKIREKAGLPPIVIPVHVHPQGEDDLESAVQGMRRGVRLNRHVQDMDPMTLAESCLRALSAGIGEKQVADDHALSVNDVHGLLLLTDEKLCPPKVQELLRDGHISRAAAIELARKAEKMTTAELNAAAEQIAKVAAGGLRVTAREVKKASGAANESPATAKEKKQFILNLHSMKLAGKYGEMVQWAAIVAMEVGLGTRTVDSAVVILDGLGKGKIPRIDFKQYQSDGQKAGPVKGQE